jgi:hypothetical protein
MTNRPDADDSPLGTSAYRRAYEDFRCDRDVLPYYLKSLDFTALPFTWAEMPEHEYAGNVYPLDEDGEPDTSADPVPIAKVIFDAIEIGRQGGVAVLPHTAKVNSI